MTQSTLDDEDLFGEAAADVRADVDDALADARAALPTPESVWETDAENVLGVLNGLKSALATGEAATHLRQAKKWFTLGARADAFEDPEALEADIEAVEAALETVEAAHGEVGELTGTVTQLRGALEEAHAAPEDDADASAETAAAGD